MYSNETGHNGLKNSLYKVWRGVQNPYEYLTYHSQKLISIAINYWRKIVKFLCTLIFLCSRLRVYNVFIKWCFFIGQSTELLDDCQKLLDRFKYPWEMMPLMYVILKDAQADIEEASRRIDEGKSISNQRYEVIKYFDTHLTYALDSKHHNTHGLTYIFK